MSANTKESAGFKLFVILGAGVALAGAIAVRRQLASGTSSAVPTSSAPSATVSTPAAIPPPSTSASSEPPPRELPTSADRAALLEAAAAGDLVKVQALHAQGVALPGTLAPAARAGKIPLLMWLIDHGVSVHEDEDAPRPPIIEAEDDEAVTLLLLARGVKEPTLLQAVRAEAPKTVLRILGTKKADPNAKTDDGDSLLGLAIASGESTKRTAIVKALLDAGAKADAKAANGETALDAAIHKVEADSAGALDVVKLLIAKAPVDRDAMMIALNMHSDRKDAVLDALLASKLPPDVAYRGVGLATDPKLVERIGAKGVAWNTKDPYIEESPLLGAARRLDLALVQALLTVGAPVDGVDDGGESALVAAIGAAAADSEDATKIVTLLLAKGANANRRTKDGRRPLHLAASRGEEAIVKALLAKGARVDDDVNGATPLEAAEESGHLEIAKLLVAKGAKKKAAPKP